MKAAVRGSFEYCRSGFYLVAFLSCSIVAVGVREMDVTRCDLHHLFDVSATFPDHMGMFCVGHIHLQSHLVHLDMMGSRLSLVLLSCEQMHHKKLHC